MATAFGARFRATALQRLRRPDLSACFRNRPYDMLREMRLRDDHRGLPLRPCVHLGAAVRRSFNLMFSERREYQHQHRASRRIAAIAGNRPRPRLAHRRASPQARPVQAPTGHCHCAWDERETLSADRPPDSSLTNASTRRIVRLGSRLVERFGSYMIAFDPRRDIAALNITD